MSTAFALLCFLGLFATLNNRAVRLWREGWKKAGMLPTAAMAIWTTWAIADIYKDPTSHNLWPIETIMMGVVGFAVFALVGIAHDIAKRRAAKTAAGESRAP